MFLDPFRGEDGGSTAMSNIQRGQRLCSITTTIFVYAPFWRFTTQNESEVS
jgi:hypothetical protein